MRCVKTISHSRWKQTQFHTVWMVSSACYMFPATNCFTKFIVVIRQFPQQCTPFLSERTSVAMDVVPWLCYVCPLRTDETNTALDIKESEWECCVAASRPLHSIQVSSSKVVCTGTTIQTILTPCSPKVEGPPKLCRARGNPLSLQKETVFPDCPLSKQHLSFSSYHFSPPLSCLYPSSLALHSSARLGGSLGLWESESESVLFAMYV